LSSAAAASGSRRYRAEGEAGLVDRSSAPEQPNRTPEERVEAIACLRRLRFPGQEIALTLGMALSTVSGHPEPDRAGKLSRLEPPEPPNRYKKSRPRELLHIDVKKLGRIGKGAGHRATGNRGQRSRGVGWEFVHICVDDTTRLAYAEVLSDEKATSCIALLVRCPRFCGGHGITVERLMTDNGSAYRSTVHGIACRALKIKHIRTRPYRPRTNGKACVLASACRPVGAVRLPAPVV
jgi:transposase InsO family protein